MAESSTSWGGGRAAESSTSWGGGRAASSSTSWGGGRARRAAQAVALAVGLAAAAAPASALAAPVHSAPVRVVVVGAHAGRALDALGGSGVRTLTPGVAVGAVPAADEAGLRAAGYHVALDSPVRLAAARRPLHHRGTAKGRPDPRGTGPAPQPAAAPGTVGSDSLTTATLPGRTDLRQILGASPAQTGQGETVAVIDSGVDQVPALSGRVIDGADFTGSGFTDAYGHGTFVAGLIAGNGLDANGRETGILGVAPAARIVSVKIAGASGESTVGQVVAGLEWVIDHAATYHINVVNLSLSVGAENSYNADPVDALVEAAWFSGITVVTSAGNDGGPVLRAPGNDPYVVTVGSVTASGTLSSFSDHGLTQDGFAKPEVTALGEHVQAPLPQGSTLAAEQTTPGLPAGYGQLSGTSMSSAVGAGVAALLLADHHAWTPDQVKGAMQEGAQGPVAELSVAASDALASPVPADGGLTPSQALQLIYAQQVLHLDVVWSDVAWSDVTWSDVVWSDVVWSDVTWSDVVWSDVVWSDVTWSDVTWSDVSTNT